MQIIAAFGKFFIKDFLEAAVSGAVRSVKTVQKEEIMAEKQISTMLGVLVGHQSKFGSLSTAEIQWVIKNLKKVISFMVAEIKKRRKMSPEFKPLGAAWETVVIPTTCERFIARRRFVLNPNEKAGPKIAELNPYFQEKFLNKIEEPMGKRILAQHRLFEYSPYSAIIAQLGGRDKAATTLAAMFYLLEKQGSGEEGPLSTECLNFFFIPDEAGEIQAVRLICLSYGWSVSAEPIEGLDEMGSGHYVFAPHALLS